LASPDVWTVTRAHIPWEPYRPDKIYPLGRNVNHDSRSLGYAHQVRRGRELVAVRHKRNAPIFDQDQVGSCTLEAGVGGVATSPLFEALPPDHPLLNQALCLSAYSDEEKILYGVGYPPEDNGGDGLTACKVLQTRGLISAYTHCLSVDAFLDALQDHAVMLGSNWYDSMDEPSSTGECVISPRAQVRGGHETLAREYDPLSQMVLLDNSWGTGFAIGGSFLLSVKTLGRLLEEQGDGTVPLPLDAPVPVPVPTPGADAADVALWTATRTWAGARHVAANRKAAYAVEAWAHIKGLS
jgi:hypothetical protein